MLRDLFSLFPAYAGVIPLGEFIHVLRPPFPRIRGGDPAESLEELRDMMLFPAYAGVIPAPGWPLHPAASFPRIRGGDPRCARIGRGGSDFSPHTRG